MAIWFKNILRNFLGKNEKESLYSSFATDIGYLLCLT